MNLLPIQIQYVNIHICSFRDFSDRFQLSNTVVFLLRNFAPMCACSASWLQASYSTLLSLIQSFLQIFKCRTNCLPSLAPRFSRRRPPTTCSVANQASPLPPLPPLLLQPKQPSPLGMPKARIKRFFASRRRFHPTAILPASLHPQWLPRLETKDNQPLNPNTLATKLSIDQVPRNCLRAVSVPLSHARAQLSLLANRLISMASACWFALTTTCLSRCSSAAANCKSLNACCFWKLAKHRMEK